MAGHSVHANPKAILFLMAAGDKDVILTGPSNMGLADPGRMTGHTLALLTVLLTQLHPTLDTLVAARVTGTLAYEAGEEFLEIQGDLETEESES
jgi:hypothetical protein